MPRISVVTPSYNQGRFIEATIRSILLQEYPDLEYVIVDGGSTDSTLATIRKYEAWLRAWSSEPDRGMYDAINKGFARTTGAIMAWSNSDDIFLPGALQTVAEVFTRFSEVQWLTSLHKVHWDQDDREVRRYRTRGFSGRSFYEGLYLPGRDPSASYVVPQQSTFWRRDLWEHAGGRVDETLSLAGDFDLWARFFRLACLYSLDEPLGVFRLQPEQKTARGAAAYVEEAAMVLQRHGGHTPGAFRRWLRDCWPSRCARTNAWLLPFLARSAPTIVRGDRGEDWRLGWERGY